MLNKAIAKGNLPKERKDEFYQLFKYPVQAAAQMNNKLLYGQLARHGKETSKDGGAGYWAKSDAAYDKDREPDQDLQPGVLQPRQVEQNHGFRASQAAGVPPRAAYGGYPADGENA